MQLHQQSVGPVNRVEAQATHTTAPQTTMMYPAGTQVYVAQTGQQPTVRYEKYAAKCANGLAVTQIAVGVMCIIFQIASLALHAEVAEIGSGIWCGILFVIAGSLGVWSSKARTSGSIVSFMVMSIISAAFTLALITCASITWGLEVDYYYHRTETREARRAKVGVNACLVVLAIVEAIVAIVSSAIACHGVCCRRSTPGAVLVAGQVQYTQGANGQQSIIIVPANQQLVTIPSGQPMMATGIAQPQPYFVQGPSMQPVHPPPYVGNPEASAPPGYTSPGPEKDPTWAQ